MSPFKRILVPVDFEAASACAVDTAIELGKTLDANVTLLHVDELPPAAYASFAEAIVWPIEEVTRAARAKLDALLKESKAKYPRVDGTLIGGRAAESILHTAKIWEADMIVMGRHGRPALSRVGLGSVAERVVRLSPVPVLVVSESEARKEDHAADDAELPTASAPRAP